MNLLKSNRRGCLKGGASLAAALTFPAIVRAATPIKMKFSSTAAVTNPIAKRLTEAADNIRKQTNGEVDITLFLAGQLGGEIDSISQTRSGAIDFTHISSITLSSIVPVASIGGLGFAFSSYDQVWAAMDGDLGALIRSGMDKVGLVGMKYALDYGFRNVTATKRQVKTPQDLQDFKIRVPPGLLWTSLFSTLGAGPTTIPVAEVYTSLITGVVDGTDLPLLTMEDMKINEVQKFVSLTSHMWDGPWIIANKASWASLSTEQTVIIQKAFADAAIGQRADVVAFNQGFIGSAGANGMTIIKPDTQAFREKLAASGFYQKWKDRFGADAWTALDKYANKLT
jgi:tripartite ATP-independent transporter DctP family solute receptor